MIAKFVAENTPGVAVGVVVGAFLPAVGRKIKALFVKETTAVKAELKAEVVKVETKL